MNIVVSGGGVRLSFRTNHLWVSLILTLASSLSHLIPHTLTPHSSLLTPPIHTRTPSHLTPHTLGGWGDGVVGWWVVGGGVGTPPSRPHTTHHTSVVKCDEVWCDVVWCGAVWCGVMRWDALRCVSLRRDAMRCDVM